jgi:7-keto-8-aminopelargonate synthetase-like enzyme
VAGAVVASGAAASVVVVPEPVVPVVGSAGGVLGSGVVVAGDSGAVVAGGVVCCGVCWATAVPPIAARAAANAISFIKASPELILGHSMRVRDH